MFPVMQTFNVGLRLAIMVRLIILNQTEQDIFNKFFRKFVTNCIILKGRFTLGSVVLGEGPGVLLEHLGLFFGGEGGYAAS